MKIAFGGKLGGKSVSIGGGALLTPYVARFMAGQGHQVFYFCRNKPFPGERDFMASENIELRYLREFPELFYYPLMPLRAIWLLKGEFSELDVVHAHIGSFAFAASYLKKRNPRVKLFITVHEVGQPRYSSSFKARWYLRAENLLMKSASKRAEAVIVHSHYMKELVAKEWGIENCLIVRTGIDVDFFKPVPMDEGPYHELWGSAEHKLLFVGRIDYRKGVLQLIEAAKYLIEEEVSLKLIIVGEGILRPSLENLISRLELSNHVSLYGRVEQEALPSLYSSADLTIVPSIYEPFGSVPLESLACGTPVIVSRNTAMKETIETSVGYFIPEITPESIANTIRHAITNGLPSSEHCRQFVCQRYDLRDIYPLYEELFQNSC